MLLHIRPQIFTDYYAVELVDLEINPFGLRLKGHDDLATRRPYPNKNYAVACRKQGRKAVDGLLIETPNRVEGFSTIARWAVAAEIVVSHHVAYVILDQDFDAASDSMMLWSGCSTDLCEWSNRRPSWATGLAPMRAQPMMEVLPPDTKRNPTTMDIVDETLGIIVTRYDTFGIPTIERGRILGSDYSSRLPGARTAFHVS